MGGYKCVGELPNGASFERFAIVLVGSKLCLVKEVAIQVNFGQLVEKIVEIK